VKLDKLVSQARRDLLANPKKAAVLGLMVLVALYFWAPLVGKWLFPEGGKKAATTGDVALILEDDPIEPTAKSKAGKGKAFRWEKIRQLIAGDRLMRPAVLEASWRDPFLKPASQLPQEIAPDGALTPEVTAAHTALATADVSSSAAGLTLSAVAIGPKRRSATINGDTYREGATIKLGGNDPKSSLLEFRVKRIERQRVELETAGKTFWIEFQQPKLAEGDEIERATEESE
jgi:hypothetical protein